MNILLFVAVLVTALHAHTPTPFHWEFDLRRCHRIIGGFDCYAPVNGALAHIEYLGYVRADYQMHPHVIAINSQGPDKDKPNRWQIIMQTRSRKQKVDLAYGMILHRLHSSKNESKFVECLVVEGKVVLRHAPELEAELVDSFFYDDHLYCDFVIWMKKDSGKTMSDLTTNQDKFALSVSMDGVVQKYADAHDYGRYKKKYNMNYEYIADKLDSFAGISETHECNVSQVIYDPKEAPEGGKLRSWEVFGDKIDCPDDRYIIHASDSKGRKLVNANIRCRNGKYEITNNRVTSDQKEWTVERTETVNVFCHVEEKLLCPISMPCNASDCPYVEFNNIALEYRLNCEDIFDKILLVGERESPFTWNGYNTICNWQHNLVANSESRYFKDDYKSPNTDATEAYCVRKDDFVHPNCTRRDPLCNGKSCSIVKSDKLRKFSVTCTNPNHVFQEFSTTSKKWFVREKELHCNSNGDWDKTWQKFVRCKDPKDTSPPVEWEESKTGSKADSKASPSEEKGPENGQTMIGHSVALLIATVILAGI